MNLIWFVLAGIAAGWLAGRIMKGGGYGVIGDLVVGVVGAVVGGTLLGMVGISLGGPVGSLMSATLGAVILIAAVRAIKRG